MRIIALIFLFTTVNAFKLEAKKVMVDGQILFKNDTINVVFIIPVYSISKDINFMKIQKKVKYLDSNKVKNELWPNDAIEFRFKYHFENVRMLSRKNNLSITNSFAGRTNIFLHLEIDGELKLYNYLGLPI